MKRKGKKILIGIVFVISAITLSQELLIAQSTEYLFASAIEALTPEEELPENGTCCPKKESHCKLKNVTVIDHYYKAAYRCDD